MFCPRCGAPNEPGDRYCSSCGATLAEDKRDAKEPKTTGERLRDLVGTTRAARLATAGTALAVLIAVVAFFVLQSDDETIPRDGYTIAADRLCLEAKRQIVAEAQRAAEQEQPPDELAAGLVPVVVNWRSQFQDLVVPADRLEQARQLERALLGAAVKIGGLARSGSGADGSATVLRAKEADAASAGVEEAVASLGLSRCAAATIGFTPSSS